MAQLISTTSVNELNLLCKTSEQIEQEYLKAYQQLQQLLGEFAVFFAKPQFKGNDKINWYTDFDGNIFPLSKATDVIDEPQELLRQQANQLYLQILAKQSDINDRRKYFDLLDRCLTIESANNIYLIISPDGKKQFVITNWGSNSKNEINILASVVQVKTVDIKVRITQGGKPLPDKTVWVRLGDQTHEYTSDKDGYIYLKNLKLLDEFTIIEKSGGKIINQRKYIVDKTEFTYEVRSNTLPKLTIKVIDNAGNPLANVNIEIQIRDKTTTYVTDSDGNIMLNDVPIGSRIIISQPITAGKKLTKSFQISSDQQQQITFKGERISGNFLVIKVLDVNGQTFPMAEMEIIIGDKRIRKIANENGLVIVNDLPLNSEILIRQIVDGLPSYQKTFTYTGEVKEVTFRSHTTRKQQKNITIRVLGDKKQPIPNLSIKLITGHDWRFAITNDQGTVVFENIDCSQPTRVEIKHRNKSIEQQLDCQNQTEFTFSLASENTKALLFGALALIAILLMAIVFSFYNKQKTEKKQQTTITQNVQDTVRYQPTTLTFSVKLRNLWDNTPVNAQLAISAGKAQQTSDSSVWNINVNPDSLPLSLTVIAKNFDTLKAKINKPNDTTLWLKPTQLYIANDTSCNAFVISKLQRFYIQKITFPKPVNSFKLKFIKRFVSDQLWLYAHKYNPAQKPIWSYLQTQPDTLIATINLQKPDSVVFIKIKAGEATTPSWRFKIYCQ